jgi:hypothetical protein
MALETGQVVSVARAGVVGVIEPLSAYVASATLGAFQQTAEQVGTP